MQLNFSCKKELQNQNFLLMNVQGVTKLWEDRVCPKGDFEKWHKLDYLMGECVECGVGKLAVCPNECSTHLSWAMA
jgi:ferredoxin-like protein FixX